MRMRMGNDEHHNYGNEFHCFWPVINILKRSLPKGFCFREQYAEGFVSEVERSCPDGQ